MEVDLGEKEGGLLCGEVTFGYFAGEGADDVLVAGELVLDILVPFEDILVAFDFEFLHFLAPEFVGVVLSTLDSSVDFAPQLLVAIGQLPMLLAFDKDAFLEVLQPFHEQSFALFGIFEHLYFQP